MAGGGLVSPIVTFVTPRHTAGLHFNAGKLR
jgi:hypothetical protein